MYDKRISQEVNGEDLGEEDWVEDQRWEHNGEVTSIGRGCAEDRAEDVAQDAAGSRRPNAS